MLLFQSNQFTRITQLYLSIQPNAGRLSQWSPNQILNGDDLGSCRSVDHTTVIISSIGDVSAQISGGLFMSDKQIHLHHDI